MEDKNHRIFVEDKNLGSLPHQSDALLINPNIFNESPHNVTTKVKVGLVACTLSVYIAYTYYVPCTVE